MNNAEIVIQTNKLTKHFPGVVALSDFSFALSKGEIHCLVGENGAGKSTFIKLLTGALHPDSGDMLIEGQRFSSLAPHTAQALGIQVIYQENILVNSMSVAENVFVGREKTNRFGLIDKKATVAATQHIVASLGIRLDPEELVENLSTADQQFVKIIKSLALNPKVLIMDEPTTMFNSKDAERVLQLVKEISGRGISVIYISHNLKEVARIADRITVLRDGQFVNCHDTAQENVDLNVIAREMVGRPVNLFYEREKSEIGEIILEIQGLKLTKTSPPLNFCLRQGEILGIAGMVGAGRTEMVRAIFGADRRAAGTLHYKGQPVNPQSPAEAIRLGFGFITEDRQKSGLVLSMNIIENTTLVAVDKFSKFLLKRRREAEAVQTFVDQFKIKTPALTQEVRFLSGGNQQKTVLAKWLYKEIDVLIVDEPTRGIDVNSKAEIYKLMAQFVKQGKSILMISSDLVELIAMSDRVLVLRNGAITSEITGEQMSEEYIIANAIEVN